MFFLFLVYTKRTFPQVSLASTLKHIMSGKDKSRRFLGQLEMSIHCHTQLSWLTEQVWQQKECVELRVAEKPKLSRLFPWLSDIGMAIAGSRYQVAFDVYSPFSFLTEERWPRWLRSGIHITWTGIVPFSLKDHTSLTAESLAHQGSPMTESWELDFVHRQHQESNSWPHISNEHLVQLP